MGGNAIEGVGYIHASECADTGYTAARTIRPLKMVYLGSFKKKEFSGDIDIGVEEESDEIYKRAIAAYGKDNVRKYGRVVSTKVPIVGYNDTIETDKKRTGFAQVDFISGDIDFMKIFYHSPVSSKLKGTHRNIAISTVAGIVHTVSTTGLDTYGRSVMIRRSKWSPTQGLVRVSRESVFNDSTKKWNKAQKETVLTKGMFTEEEICEFLFNTTDTSVIDSAESIIAYLAKLPDVKYTNQVFDQMAINFSEHKDIGSKDWDYPKEIAERMPAKVK